jgi:citrate lyase subunit beta/citryl-CoA lyase
MPTTSISAMDWWDEHYPGHRFHFAMGRTVVAARAAGLRAIDSPLADYKDLDAYSKMCIIARGLGCDGKWYIHPLQIAIANEAFSPTEQELQWAREVVTAYEQAMAKGTGAISVGDRMIDMASVRMAQMMLKATEGI